MINPKRLMEMKRIKDQFEQRHPKFSMFLQDASKEGIQEGSIIEINITRPDGRQMCSNIRVAREDLDVFDTLKELR